VAYDRVRWATREQTLYGELRTQTAAQKQGAVLDDLLRRELVGPLEHLDDRLGEADIGQWLGVKKSDTELCHDYLRGVWVTAAQQIYATSGAPRPSADVLERQLADRFHQDFRVRDDVPRPAAALPVAILA
jgi:hypothetical protein